MQLIILIRYVFQQVIVADGNFKANHVQAKTPSQDIWLSEGSGMIPTCKQYNVFLETAMEKWMVRGLHLHGSKIELY